MKKIIIESKNVGQRIDKFLAKEFFLYTRGEVIRRIKSGEVLVNGKQVKPSYVVEEGDTIELQNFSKNPPEKNLKENFSLELNVLFENKNFIIIDKQAGIQVHPSHNERENTLVNAIITRYSEIKNVHEDGEGANFRPGIVHRLDKDTSGIMVIARNQKTFHDLKELFKDRKIEKTYLALAEGIFNEKEGIIDKAIARSTNYKKQVIARTNTKTTVRNAKTNYKVLEEFQDYSLVEVKPKTGRMHQIRIHLDSIGHPVVGDKVYGIKKAKIHADRQLLHAYKLEFELNGEKFEFISPIPDDFNAFVR